MTYLVKYDFGILSEVGRELQPCFLWSDFFIKMYFSYQKTPLIPAQAGQAHWMRV
jgi:hypothetical protein